MMGISYWTTKEVFSVLRVEERTPTGWQPASNIVVTALKPAEEVPTEAESAWLLRIVEMHGRAAKVRIKTNFQVLSVEEVNLIEGRIRTLAVMDPQFIELGEMKPGGICMLRIRTN